jgi:hypothetical protein
MNDERYHPVMQAGKLDRFLLQKMSVFSCNRDTPANCRNVFFKNSLKDASHKILLKIAIETLK